MKEATGTRHRVLEVQEGVVVPPVLLRRLLPDIASIVKDAMTAGVSKLVQYSPCNTQDTDDRCRPQDTDDRCKPQDTDDTSKPQDTESASKLQDADSTCKQQNIDDTSKSQDNDKCKPPNQKNILNPFPCNICKLRFPSRYTLNTHLLLHESMCVMCKIDFGSRKLLLKHKCWFCKICAKPCASFDHKHYVKATQYNCEICNETFEDSLAATSHRRTHGAPVRSYTRKPKAANAQEKRTEPVNIVEGLNLNDVPIEPDGDPEPQERVNMEDGHEDICNKRSNEDLGRDGVTEPKRKSVKVEIKLDFDEETRNPNEKGLYSGETKHLGDVKVEPNVNFEVVTNTLHELLRDRDMREAIDKVDVVTEESFKVFEIQNEGKREIKEEDEPNDKIDVVTYTSTLHETLDKGIREDIGKVDVVTEESSKLFEAVKIEPEVRLEIKKEANESELEVLSEEQDVKAYPLGLSTSELSPRHQILDGMALGPVRVRASNVYTGKDAMTAASNQVQHSTCNPQETDCCGFDVSKPQHTYDTSKLRDAESTSKSQDTNKKRKPQARYECRKCKIQFGSKKLFVKHKCCICNICHKPRARSHNKCRKVLTCICGETFTRIADFTTHQKIHSQIYGSCPVCSKQFTNSTDLINHVDNMKYPCIYCDTCFPDLEQLLAHNKGRKNPPKHSCKLCKETFEDILTATLHRRTHGAPVRSYTRKPKAVNAQEKREAVNIVKGQNLSDVPIELDGDPEPQERVNMEDRHEDICNKRSNEDLGRDGVTEPKRKSVKVEIKLDFDDETINPNQKGLYSGETKHIGDVKVEPDLRYEPNDNFDVVTYTSTLPETLDKDIREAIDKVDVVTEESSKLFEAVKIEPQTKHLGDVKAEPGLRDEANGNFEVLTNTLHELLRDRHMSEAIDKVDVGTEESFKVFKIENEGKREIKEELNERLESVRFDEVMDEVQDVKAGPKLSTSELYAGHLIEDGIALGPVRVRAPILYTGKNALRKNTSAQMLEPCPIKVEPADTPDEIEAVDIERKSVTGNST